MAKAAAGGADSRLRTSSASSCEEGCPLAGGGERPALGPEVRDAAVLPPQGSRRVRSSRDATQQVGAVARPPPDPQVGRREAPPRERPTGPHLVQQPGLWMADADPDVAAKGKSLAEIAETLNSKRVPPAHGTNR